jgi:ABC-type nickel/cobalt efflux system permease component RcnA
MPSGSALVSIFPTQSEYHRQFSELIRAAGADDRVVWGLIGLSFLYGVFQAAKPEYSKALISSYLGASTETWRRGLALAFASALFEATLAARTGDDVIGAAKRCAPNTRPAARKASSA